VTDAFLTSLEVLPTLAAIASVRPDEKIPLDGFDLLPVLRGERPSPRTEMFWQRRGDSAARIDQWKWIRTPKGTSVFDLAAEPGEAHDLGAERPDLVRTLEARFNAWRQAMDAAEPRGPFRDY
jgi:arylsulfatase A-like enzyme